MHGQGTALLSIANRLGHGDGDLTTLLDAQHQPCGYIVNGDLLHEAWESRVLPGETGRVSAAALLEALAPVPRDSLVEIVQIGTGLFGGTKTRSRGFATQFDFTGRSWAASAAPRRKADPLAVVTEVFGMGLIRPDSDLAVSIGLSGDEEPWVTAVEVEDGLARLVLGPDAPLPDAPPP